MHTTAVHTAMHYDITDNYNNKQALGIAPEHVLYFRARVIKTSSVCLKAPNTMLTRKSLWC